MAGLGAQRAQLDPVDRAERLEHTLVTGRTEQAGKQQGRIVVVVQRTEQHHQQHRGEDQSETRRQHIDAVTIQQDRKWFSLLQPGQRRQTAFGKFEQPRPLCSDDALCVHAVKICSGTVASDGRLRAGGAQEPECTYEYMRIPSTDGAQDAERCRFMSRFLADRHLSQ